MTVPDTEALHNERQNHESHCLRHTRIHAHHPARGLGGPAARCAVYDIPDAITSLHHGLLSQVTNAFTKIATLGIYIAVYEAYRFTEWSMQYSAVDSGPGAVRPVLLLGAPHTTSQCHVGLACGAHSSEYTVHRTAADLYRRVIRLGVLPAPGGARYPMADAGDRGPDRPAVPVLGAHRADRPHGRAGPHSGHAQQPPLHHGQNDYCIDKNYGGILVLWDRLFGTLPTSAMTRKLLRHPRPHSFSPIRATCPTPTCGRCPAAKGWQSWVSGWRHRAAGPTNPSNISSPHLYPL